MNKEWLEFLGGLFVLLGALVPVIRGFWKRVRKKLELRDIMRFVVAALTVATILAGMIGLLREWNPGVVGVLFIASINLMGLMFMVSPMPLGRFEIAMFVVTVAITVLIISLQFRKSDLRQSRKSFPDAPTPTPTATVTPIPNSN